MSFCLLGEKVRHDGGHKHDPYLTMTLGKFFEWIPVCPEVEAGFGIPRESMRLVKTEDRIRMLGKTSKADFTERMNEFSSGKLRILQSNQLHGYIFKKNSPSCGVEKVKIYTEKGISHVHGRGLFADAFIKHFPLIPVEEEGRLHDLHLRENFIERVFGYYRWTELLEKKPGSRDLVKFHTRYKMTLLSHSTRTYHEMGRIVANCGKRMTAKILDHYGALLMDALKKRATAGKHANVLYHLLGFLKKAIDEKDKAELVGCIEEFRTGRFPLMVPLTLLKHHFSRHPDPWVLEQTYLNPYPAELMLRNHA